ncbi:lipoprotein signal peptidase [Halolactibacillus alkaliphilus]|uniref:Lipoprotein signal peptidase n=1 Tax=Halolactibacillus alkaliphilus TaxID=442899 RepID=A0A511WX66_9BACI|nr:signal peptidase II [Halolactibacillus alkaliphilus]GEN55714.1 lipoprotein signal peptidase [Halolactibacillus alkaliphilus]GGN65274.1 lipoprotein signal peptidase [Halolactibacillus alkaliphilus]SFO64009.1 signal peptidase II [Halolactibacillus alkaliphilus]
MNYLIALVVIIFDQWTKYLVIENMAIGESIPIIDNLIYLTSHRNPGAAWGILAGQMWFFYIITVIVIGIIIYYMETYSKGHRLLGLSLALVLGGAIGNFIDRVRFQEVVDFVDVYIFSYDYPIFNVADSSLVIGVILIGIITLLEEVRKDKKV